MIWFILVGLAFGIFAWRGKFLTVRKDGGPESRVTGYWLIELKWLFSVALLRFDHGSRETFHSHAFNSISWVLGPGVLREELLNGNVNHYVRSWRPVTTLRRTFHRVFSEGRTWVLTFRGPWANEWMEFSPDGSGGVFQRLTHGRQIVWKESKWSTT
jgi:hypothetical protein